MLRKTLTIVSLIGLLLSLGMWVRSYRWIDTVLIPTSRISHFEATSGLGVIRVARTYDSRRPLVEEVQYIASDAQEYGPRTWFPKRPFGWEHRLVIADTMGMNTKAVTFPHWLLVLLFSIPLFVEGYLSGVWH